MKIKPMHAMKVDYHLRCALESNQFSDVSDKLRGQLIELGYDNKTATLQAPVMLNGIIMALNGDLDISRMHRELDEEARNSLSLTPSMLV